MIIHLVALKGKIVSDGTQCRSMSLPFGMHAAAGRVLSCSMKASPQSSMAALADAAILFCVAMSVLILTAPVALAAEMR